MSRPDLADRGKVVFTGEVSFQDALRQIRITFSVTIGSKMKFAALGPLTVVSDSDPVQLRPAHRRLLASLLLSPGVAVPMDTLIYRMWGESAPSQANNTIHVHLSAVRQLVPNVLHGGSDGYQLELNGHGFDVNDFTALVDRAARRLEQGRFREAGALADRAGKLWRGNPFPELVDVDDARGERHRLVELLTASQITLAKALTLQGRVSESIAVLRQLVVEQPLNEELWEELILAYYLAGRQSDALRAFGEASRTLRDELGVQPGIRLRELEDKVLLQDPVLIDETLVAVPHNLPDLESTVVGREEDIEGVGALLGRNHLVTITGAPGVGKTRLAIETARQLLPSFPGGVWMVRLVGARTGDDVAASIASAMSVTEGSESLADLFSLLAPRPALVILDNCEHLIGPVTEFVRHRLHGSRLRVLATSRTRLDLGDEVVWPLRPLPVPDSPEHLWESSTGRLLAYRMTAEDPTLDLSDVDGEAVLDLCNRTGGIPLVVELAAAVALRVDLSAISGLAATSGGDSPTPDDPHHSSLAEAVGWSVDLLDGVGRLALQRASVFAGAFTLDAFHRVCLPKSTAEQAIATVGDLVGGSLLIVERTPLGSRYRMLEPIRECAAAGFNGRAKRAARDRHADWFVEVSLGNATTDNKFGEAEMFARTDFEIADHRVAMRHLLDTGRADQTARIAAGLLQYWIGRWLSWEGLAWFEECLKHDLDDFSKMLTLGTAGVVAGWANEGERGVEYADRALELAVAMGHERGQAQALATSGRLLSVSGDRTEGFERQLRSIAIYDALGETDRAVIPRSNIGFSAAVAGETDKARRYILEALEGLGDPPGPRMATVAYCSLVTVDWYHDDEASAREHVSLALQYAGVSNDWRIRTEARVMESLVEATWGDPARAADIVIAAVEQAEGLPDTWFPFLAGWTVPLLARAGAWELVVRLIDFVDGAEKGSLDDRNPGVARYRAPALDALDGTFVDREPVPVSQLRAELLDTLSAVREAVPVR